MPPKMVHLNSNHYWAFLEEIEAPMWVDLSLEGKSYNQNIDDKWFYTHHQVHQSSSHDLKLVFAQLYDEKKTLDFELIKASSSPTLPDSVSRSRGKDFDGRKCKGNCRGFAMNKEVVVIGSSSEGKESVDSRTSSTIVSGIGHQQQHKPTEVTSQSLSSSSKLLLDMRRSLRKSCATRQASRLEVNNCRRQSSGRNSSISSSLNPSFGSKNITKTSEHHLKNSQCVGGLSRMTQASMNKSKVLSVLSSTLKVQLEGVSSNSRRVVGKLNNANPEASKPKILRPKASLLLQRDNQNSCLNLKKKEGLERTGRCKTVEAGKENAVGRIAVSQKCKGRVIPSTFSMVKDQKKTQHNVPLRLGGRSVFSLKQQAKICHPSEGKILENGSKRVYFR
ncbi:uncharacterized protein LOC101210465 isoform X1 [Cucumis sativus]|nr:uncharacterized protein LOC101210465 isoform X1 [Cucumis sativus]